MDQYISEKVIAGPIFGAVAIESFIPGATISFGTNGKPILVTGRDVHYAPADGWDQVLLTGIVTVLVWRSPLWRDKDQTLSNERPGSRGAVSPTQGADTVDAVGMWPDSIPAANPITGAPQFGHICDVSKYAFLTILGSTAPCPQTQITVGIEQSQDGTHWPSGNQPGDAEAMIFANVTTAAGNEVGFAFGQGATVGTRIVAGRIVRVARYARVRIVLQGAPPNGFIARYFLVGLGS